MRTVLFMAMFLVVGCASIEERCWNEVKGHDDMDPEMKKTYFSSCVETKRLKGQAISNSLNFNKGHKSVTCITVGSTTSCE